MEDVCVHADLTHKRQSKFIISVTRTDLPLALEQYFLLLRVLEYIYNGTDA